MKMASFLIVNADDFGYSQGINHGILTAHVQGIVSSTSLMVDAPNVVDAAAQARRHPSLGVGLHFTATNEHAAWFDLNDLSVIEHELDRQYQRICELMGRVPTHLDSHHHVHLREHLKPLFISWADEHDLQLRGLGNVQYNGEFYGQWYDENWHPHPLLEHISVGYLEKILRSLPDGITELACHPGYVTQDLDSSYRAERAIELATLIDPRVRSLIDDLNITRMSFAGLANHLHVPK
jgi:predicted glycoside hydrolase/deacetylase ChbG (UPF0249 family)